VFSPLRPLLVADPAALAREWRVDSLREDHEDRVARPRTDETLQGEIVALEDAIEYNQEALEKSDVKYKAIQLRHPARRGPSAQEQGGDPVRTLPPRADRGGYRGSRPRAWCQLVVRSHR
jgi:hypothetical protein